MAVRGSWLAAPIRPTFAKSNHVEGAGLGSPFAKSNHVAGGGGMLGFLKFLFARKGGFSLFGISMMGGGSCERSHGSANSEPLSVAAQPRPESSAASGFRGGIALNY